MLSKEDLADRRNAVRNQPKHRKSWVCTPFNQVIVTTNLRKDQIVALRALDHNSPTTFEGETMVVGDGTNLWARLMLKAGNRIEDRRW